MIHPCCGLTVAISLTLPIHSSERAGPIHSNSVLAIQWQSSASSDISGPFYHLASQAMHLRILHE